MSAKPNPLVTAAIVVAILLPTVFMAIWLSLGFGDQAGFAVGFDPTPPAGSDESSDAAYVSNHQWRTFNWHPMLMVVAYTAMLGLAAISFKRLPFAHNTNKYIHFGLQTLAVICSSIAIATVYQMKEHTVQEEFSDPTAGDNFSKHMSTAHAWVGWITYLLYCLQYLLGAVSFLLPPPYPPVAWRRVIHPFHICLGCLLMVMTASALVSGAMSRYWLVSLADVSPPMTNVPHFGFTSLFGSLSTALIMVYMAAVFSLHVGKKGGYQVQHDHNDLSDEQPVNSTRQQDDVMKPLLDGDADDFLDYGAGTTDDDVTYSSS